MKKQIKKIEEEKIEKPIETPKEKVEETPIEEPISSIGQPEVKIYMGKKIISKKISIINEKEYICLTLEDGSICQISENEYSKIK